MGLGRCRMTARVLFLHGVGQPASKTGWRLALNLGLSAAGYVAIEDDQLISPNYLDLLVTEPTPKAPMPVRHGLPSASLRARRVDYELAQASMRRLLGVEASGPLDGGPFASAPDSLADRAKEIAVWWDDDLRQADRYMRHEGLRAAILHRVLAKLPPGELDLVIIGHSLGTLVAIDLLDHLSADVSVRRLITLGSPAALRSVHEGSERLLKQFPFGRVKSWLNAISTGDPISAGRGLAKLFPAAQDVRLDLPFMEHGVDTYLRDDRVASAVGEAVYGSKTKDVASRPTALEVRPTDAEHAVLFAIAFAHLIKNQLGNVDEDRAFRFGDALTIVQRETYHRLHNVALQDGRPVAIAVAALKDGQVPSFPRAWQGDLDSAVKLLVTAATTNLLYPYDISAHEPARNALEPAAVGLGFSADQGRQVRLAISGARAALGLDGGLSWARIAIGAAGVALIAAVPVLLVAAAPAGLAGAAAITSALAAFGPGGMVGGMILAGGMGVSGAVATTAAMLADASQPVLEVEVLRRIAHADARKRLGLPSDFSDWLLVVSVESEVAHQLASHRGISDDDSATIKTLRSKSELLHRAIRWMVERDLAGMQLEPAYA